MEIRIPEFKDISYKLGDDVLITEDSITFTERYSYPSSDWLCYKGQWYHYFSFTPSKKVYKRCALICFGED